MVLHYESVWSTQSVQVENKDIDQAATLTWLIFALIFNKRFLVHNEGCMLGYTVENIDLGFGCLHRSMCPFCMKLQDESSHKCVVDCCSDYPLESRTVCKQAQLFLLFI